LVSIGIAIVVPGKEYIPRSIVRLPVVSERIAPPEKPVVLSSVLLPPVSVNPASVKSHVNMLQKEFGGTPLLRA